MTDLAWLAVNIDRMKVADLTDLCNRLCRDRLIPKCPATTDGKRLAVRAARGKYWDTKFETRGEGRTTAHVGYITAAEANAWLQTLPWVPHV